MDEALLSSVRAADFQGFPTRLAEAEVSRVRDESAMMRQMRLRSREDRIRRPVGFTAKPPR